MIRKMDATFKICIFGDGGVGKTTLTERYLTGVFINDTQMTLGTNFYRKTVSIEGQLVLLQIWDFGGEKQFRSLFPTYILGASGAVFVYDTTRYSSLKNLKVWMDLLKEGLKDLPIPIIMAGSKMDLVDKRAVEKEVAEKVQNDNGLLDYIECSSKTGENLESIFYKLTFEMIKNASLLH